MLNLRRCAVGVVAVLLMGAAGCSSPSRTETDAHTPTVSDSSVARSAAETAEVAELRVRANAGDADAQYNLGLTLRQKFDPPVSDYETLAAWYGGVPQYVVEAVSWSRKAAEQGVVSAQFLLGQRGYLVGLGVPTDRVEAYKWLILAAERESSSGSRYFAARYETARDRVRQSLRWQDHIEDAEQRAADWLTEFEQSGGK